MATSRIKGITVEIGGDTTKLQTALKGVNSEIKNTQSQLKDVEKLLKLDPGNTELLAQKQKLLSSAVSETKEKLLKKANNKEAYDEVADEIFKLREQREKCTVDTAARDAQIARINELQDFIKQPPSHLEAFDEALVKRWLERIIVWEDHFTVELKSGLKIDIEG